MERLIMKTMSRRERVLAALNHKESDIIPHFCEFTLEARKKIRPYFSNEDFENIDLNNHLLYDQYWGWPTEKDKSKPEMFTDEYGVTWNRSGVDKDIGVVETPIISAPDISMYREPHFDENRFRQTVEQVVNSNSDQFKFYGIGFSLFERAWSYLTIEEALYNMVAEEAFMHELFDRICEYNLRLIEILNEYPIDAVYFGDDWGQQKGTMMGPHNWRKFIKPRLSKMYEAVKSKGRYVIQHSCGDISEVFPDLIEIGLDCYQTFQSEIYDLDWFKREYGQDLAVWGGISTQQILPKYTPEQIRAETIRIIRTMSKKGGYIAAPTHAVAHDVSYEQIMAMQEVFQNQDKYL
jgi:uroporphyrinogen decarboxylase